MKIWNQLVRRFQEFTTSKQSHPASSPRTSSSASEAVSSGGNAPSTTPATDSMPVVSHPNYFWAGEFVLPLLASDKREGQVKRLIDAETVEVDWLYWRTGDRSGVKTEKERDLRLDPNSTSNRNPYRIGDLVKYVNGDRLKITGIWDEDEVDAEKVDGGSGTYRIRVTYLSPNGTTGEKIKLRAARKDRTAVSSDTLAASLSPNLMISELSPSPVGMVLQTEPRRMIKLGDTLESMKSDIGDPVAKGTANKWGTQTGAVEIYCYAGGGVFKVRRALVFVDGKLTAFADWSA
jgi:hypothetical protein